MESRHFAFVLVVLGVLLLGLWYAVEARQHPPGITPKVYGEGGRLCLPRKGVERVDKHLDDVVVVCNDGSKFKFLESQIPE